MGFDFLFCLISFGVSIMHAGGSRITKCSFESMYQLGDSTSDTGNLIRMLPGGPFLPAARPPYGQTFPGQPTGRWSDGRLIIDFTAAVFGLPMLNPYLNKNASFQYGVNFAVAGATALDSSFFASRGITVPPSVGSLNRQLTWFKTFQATICSMHPSDCGDRLKKSLILMGEIGGNDINYPLAQGKSLEEIRTYVPFINQAIVNATREIILAGASQIVVPGNFPIGCIPFAFSIFSSNDSTAYDETRCIKRLNNLATYQNSNLRTALSSLKKEFPDAVILYSDYYNAFLKVLRQARILGFDGQNLFKPCCQSRDYNPSSPEFCGGIGVPVCSNPNQYLHWDGLHLTQEAHHQISKTVVPNIALGLKCIL